MRETGFKFAGLMTALFMAWSGTSAHGVPAANASEPDLLAPSYATAPAGSVSVRESVEATLRYNHGLKVIQENLEVTRHELRRAKAGYGPRLDLTGRYGTNELSTSTTRSYGTDTGLYGTGSVGLLLTQPLWDGFATRSRVATARATVDSMSYRVFDNATTFALDGLIAHVDLLRRREIARLAEANVQQHENILISQRERVNSGVSSVADVSQSEGRLARARSTLSDARASLREAEAAYTRLTGNMAPSDLEEVPLPSLSTDADAVMEQARSGNPKLRAYLADVEARRGEKKLAESVWYPAINLEAGPSYSDRAGHGSQWEKEWGVAATVRWNIFNSGADSAEVRAATARIRQARQEASNFVDDMDEEIANTWTRYRAAEEQRDFYAEAVEYNIQTRDAYREQFLMGQRSLLDVLDAENELFNSSTQLATSQGNVLVGAYRLHALSGDLLTLLNVDTDALYQVPEEADESAR